MGHKQRQHFPSKAGLPDIASQAASSSEANVPLIASSRKRREDKTPDIPAIWPRRLDLAPPGLGAGDGILMSA